MNIKTINRKDVYIPMLFFLFIFHVFSLKIKSKKNIEFVIKDNDFEIKDIEFSIDDSLNEKELIVEDDYRKLVLENNEQSVTDALSLLKTYKQPPVNIDSIVNSLQNYDEEQALKSGGISFAIFFLRKMKKEEIEHGNLRIYISSDEELAKKLNTPFPGCYGYNALELVDYRIPIKSFIQATSTIMVPILKKLTVDTLKLFNQTTLPTLFFFVSEMNNIDEYELIAKKYRDRIKIGLLIYKEEKGMLEHYNISEKDLPATVSFYNKRKYRESNLNPEKFELFISKFLKGKLKSYEKSGNEPEDNEERTVKEITRNNYEKYFKITNIKTEEDDDSKEVEQDGTEEVADSDEHKEDMNYRERDVLITFSSNFCGYCKQLTPIFKELGELNKKNGKDRVVIAHCNSPENDFPEFAIKGYPTVALIVDGKIKYYNKERTLDGFIQFIENEGKFKVNLKTGEIGYKEEILKEAKKQKEDL